MMVMMKKKNQKMRKKKKLNTHQKITKQLLLNKKLKKDK